jgi:hypothetical protein
MKGWRIVFRRVFTRNAFMLLLTLRSGIHTAFSYLEQLFNFWLVPIRLTVILQFLSKKFNFLFSIK